MSRLSSLISASLPSETTAVQQKSYVTFTYLSPTEQPSDAPGNDPTITLLERRHLISGSSTTGFRTWEAALHLGSYLLSSPAQNLVKNRNVFELGTGTGFISILCKKLLQANHVTATDGDEGVVEALKENLFLNSLDNENEINASVLRWGHGLRGSWVEEEMETWPYDVVLGADIVSLKTSQMGEADNRQTYDKAAVSALVATLRQLFELRPSLQVLISGAVRNAETFESFRHACGALLQIPFVARPRHH